MLFEQSTKMTSNLKQNKQKIQITQQQKTCSLKEWIENADLHK